jgi:hypothetical protein
LDFVEGAANGRLDVSAAEHGGAKCHEIRDGVVAIANQLLEIARNERLGHEDVHQPVDSPLG